MWKSADVPDTAPLPLAFVMTSFEPGGTERQMIELLRRLDRRRWTIHIACTRAAGPWFARAAESAASVAEFPISSFKRLSTIREMRALAAWFRDRDIAVAHTVDLYANIFGLPAAALARVPARIANRREINPDKSLPQIAAQRAAYGCAHHIVANSGAARNRLTREGVAARRVRVVANGIDGDAYVPRTLRPPLRRILTVANLRGEKGHDVLIEAAPQVLRNFPDAQFDLAGTGPERDALMARAAARGVARAFSFLGHCEDVPAQLAQADVFVLPSRSEAFPNALLEAMACGLPVVASAVGGICELIDQPQVGMLVPPGNPAALAAAICRVLANPPLAAALGSAARTQVLERYSFERMVDAFDHIYREPLRARGIVGSAHDALIAPPSSATVS
jgi:glycosyltransferase involved in cell wall biosynthesis